MPPILSSSELSTVLQNASPTTVTMNAVCMRRPKETSPRSKWDEPGKSAKDPIQTPCRCFRRAMQSYVNEIMNENKIIEAC